MNYVQYELQVK